LWKLGKRESLALEAFFYRLLWPGSSDVEFEWFGEER
jgi:hypothetical protein